MSKAALRFALLALLAATPGACLAEQATLVPSPSTPAAEPQGAQTLVLAGGCFWGVQGVFQHVKGVTQAVSGYAGGARSAAQYEIVSGGRSGHAESVKITYDPEVVGLGELLRVYFSVAHDPTQINRQGPDTGAQYRSAIFFASPGQERFARDYIAQIEAAGVFPQKIATRLEALTEFYPAETYHQDYLTRHPEQPYIVYNDLPKIAALKRLLPALYRDPPVLVAP
jgi:peptide-methionine (S)-S-oxide reductase